VADFSSTKERKQREANISEPLPQNIAAEQAVLSGVLSIPQKLRSLPVIILPRGVFSKILKIAAFKGIPAQILAASEVTKLVLRHWDSRNKRPR